MSQSKPIENSSIGRDQMLLGRLPDDFLRILDSPEGNEAREHSSQQQYQQSFPPQQNAEKVPRLSITIVQANLSKNYGLTRMDPYVRVRVGTSVLETNTAINGGKNPVWNKVFQVTPQPGYDSIFIEVFDERSFTVDDKIAWTHVIIPEDVLTSTKVSNEWYPLSGRQGDNREGSVNIILSYTYASVVRLAYPSMYPGAQVSYPIGDNRYYVVPQPYAYPPIFYPGAQPAYTIQGATAIPAQQVVYPPNNKIPPQQLPNSQQPLPQLPQQQQHPQQQQQQILPQQHQQNVEHDIDTLKEMFPTLDRSTIETVLLNNHNNKEISINQLLNLTSWTPLEIEYFLSTLNFDFITIFNKDYK